MSGCGGAPAAIAVTALEKTFRIPHEPYTRVKDAVLHPFAASRSESLPCLRDVSFDVGAGEFLGVVGRNGSGKSTLLRCLAGIYRPDSGRVALHGRVAPFIELGVGFNPEMTGRDNALINAVMLGLGPAEARRRMPEVFAFAELEGFAGMRLKNYSAGMLVRLAFAVTVQVDADILLFDEVLAVGDESFQRKCVERFQQLKDQGRTLVLVTHDMDAIERFCDRAMLLERGALVEIGAPMTVARRYHQVNAEHGQREPQPTQLDGPVEFVDAWFEDGAGRRQEAIGQGAAACACVEVRALGPVDAPEFVLSLLGDGHRPVFRASSGWHSADSGGSVPAGSRVLVRMRFENWLAAGRYELSAAVWDGGGQWVGERSAAAEMVVFGSRVSGGVVDLPHSFEVRRG